MSRKVVFDPTTGGTNDELTCQFEIELLLIDGGKKTLVVGGIVDVRL